MAKGIRLQSQTSNPLGAGEKGVWFNNSGEMISENGVSSTNVSGSISSPRRTIVDLYNNTGGSRYLGEPISIDGSGNLSVTNVSSQASSLSSVGVMYANTPNATQGSVIMAGVLENITGSFSFGDALYVSKTSGLQATYPDTGVLGFVAGDYVIRVGVVSKNQTNGLLKDLLVNVQIIGQLA